MMQFGSRRRRSGRGMFDTDGDDGSVLEGVQESVGDQLREARDSADEAIRIMQVQSWKASAEILTGLLAIARSQVARAEKKAPKIEKLVVE